MYLRYFPLNEINEIKAENIVCYHHRLFNGINVYGLQSIKIEN